MRPGTLRQTFERIAAGEDVGTALPEFLDAFYLAGRPDVQIAMINEEPSLTGNARFDALAGAVAEYLARQCRLAAIPEWAFGSARYLERAWHTSPFPDPGFREYLTFTSPAEFSSRSIFTEEAPLRRARGIARQPRSIRTASAP
jgi:hypothetical protein